MEALATNLIWDEETNIPEIDEYEVIEGEGKKSRKSAISIGEMNGFYALFFAIAGQVVKDAYGEFMDDVFRFPNSADAALDVFFGRGQLTDENSYLARIEGSGRKQHFVDVEPNRVQTKEKELQMKTNTIGGVQMSLNDLLVTMM